METLNAASTTETDDSLLQPFLRDTRPGVARRRLKRILVRVAAPAVERVVWRKSGVSPQATGRDAEDARDTFRESVSRIANRLRDCRERRGAAGGIGDFIASVVVTAHRTWYAVTNRADDRREALRSRLRFLLANTPGLALWWDASAGEPRLLAGLHGWNAEVRTAGVPSSSDLRDACPTGIAPDDLRPFLFRLFHVCQMPVEINALVTAVTHLNGWRPEGADQPVSNLSDTSGSMTMKTTTNPTENPMHDEISRFRPTGKDPAASLSEGSRQFTETRQVRLTREEALRLLTLCASSASEVEPVEATLFAKIRRCLSGFTPEPGA